jgi:GNAT superfamily N-acetyltransferase
MSIEIHPLRTARERRIFLTFPWRIYRDDPLWVPPLLPERAKAIDPQRGAFFERGEAEFFIAWRDGQPVGTICAAEDKAANTSCGKHECVFGFFECINDYSVAVAMLQHVARWARRRNLETLFGPFNLDYEDSYGVLIEGRDRPPTLLCGHTPPYYQTFFERLGFEKARGDNLAYAFDLTLDTPSLRHLSRLAERVRQRGHIRIREADLSQWDVEIGHVHRLLNHALAHLPDHIPWRCEELSALLSPFRKIADPELVLFAEVDGELGSGSDLGSASGVVGWFPGLPNLNEIFYHVNGLRYPWDYLKLLWAMRPVLKRLDPSAPSASDLRMTKCLAVKSVLVLPEYWGSGIIALFADEMRRRAIAKGFTWIDLSLTSEDNPHTPVLADRLGAKLYKRYRTYRVDVDRLLLTERL